MSLKTWIENFVTQDTRPLVVSLVRIPPDTDLLTRNLQRLEEARDKMGEKYICHSTKRVQRAADQRAVAEAA